MLRFAVFESSLNVLSDFIFYFFVCKIFVWHCRFQLHWHQLGGVTGCTSLLLALHCVAPFTATRHFRWPTAPFMNNVLQSVTARLCPIFVLPLSDMARKHMGASYILARQKMRPSDHSQFSFVEIISLLSSQGMAETLASFPSPIQQLCPFSCKPM